MRASIRLCLLALLAAFGAGSLPAAAQDITGSISTGASGLPLPRFATLKSARINMRSGPGKDYKVEWSYRKSGLPVEIIQEYDNWRKVRDAEGDTGWIHVSLLTGKRAGIAAPWATGDYLDLHRAASDGSSLVAKVEPGVLGEVRRCDGEWCEMNYGGHQGFMRQAELWGVYPGERVTD